MLSLGKTYAKLCESGPKEAQLSNVFNALLCLNTMTPVYLDH